MIQTINERQFVQAFHDHDRGHQFTPEALGYIFDYFEQRERDSEIHYTLDVIALCCEISELSVEEVVRDYILDQNEEYIADDWSMDDVKHYLYNVTEFIGETPDGNVIFYQF
jgi:hypothetical protein